MPTASRYSFSNRARSGVPRFHSSQNRSSASSNSASRPFAAPPPPGAQPPPLWGSEEHLTGLFGNRVDFHTLQRDTLEITAFTRAHDYAEHFKAYYGPTISARANAVKNGRVEAFDQALDRFCDEWNRGTPDRARFEKEYLLAVGTRR